MTFKPFSPDRYLFIKTLTVSIEQCEKVNLFKPNTPQRQMHRFLPHSPYCPVVNLNGPRAYIRTPLYVNDLPAALNDSAFLFADDVKMVFPWSQSSLGGEMGPTNQPQQMFMPPFPFLRLSPRQTPTTSSLVTLSIYLQKQLGRQWFKILPAAPV